MIKERKAGMLMHITSLPNKYGIGTLGKECFDFIDFISDAKMSVWQVLPLVPTSYGDSPYQSVCSSALNYYMIDLDTLNRKKLLNNSSDKNFLNSLFSLLNLENANLSNGIFFSKTSLK